VVPTDRTRGNKHKLKCRRFPLNIKKHFFTVRVTGTGCPERLCIIPPLEILKSFLDMVLAN